MSEHTPRSRHLTHQQRGRAGGRAGGLPQSLGAGEWDIFISYGRKDHQFTRRLGDIRREPLAVLQNIRRTFAGQYQQSPGPLGGSLVKAEWFVFRANEPTAHRTYAHYILTQGASGGPLAPDGLR